MWIRGLGGEKFPVASWALLPNLKKGLYFAIREGSRFFVACFLRRSSRMCLCQTPGRRPPRITGCLVKNVTREGGSEPQARAPLQISWRRCWLCRSISVEDSKSRRFKLTFSRVFLRAISAQHPPRIYLDHLKKGTPPRQIKH